MRKNFACGVAFAALMIPAAAFAQSTGTIDEESKNDVIVTGTRTAEVGGVQVPDTSKTRGVLTDQVIQRQIPGQSINDTINLLPGVSFQNNDPYGTSGGTLTIRGFDQTRISETFDGIPVNDTGNYQLYSGQQLDPELIEQVNVSLGSTDVDSPTAAATGSTVNYRSRNPTEDFHVRMQGSVGEYDFFRVFGVVDTGNLTKFGTRLWVAASHAQSQNPYNRVSGTEKDQYNAKLYQPIGSNGDFVSVSGHYNINRNNNYSSSVLRIDQTQIAVTGTAPRQTITTTPRVVGTATANRFPLTRDERFYSLGGCTTDTPERGVADVANSCGTAFDYSYNPSDTANFRANSRFTLADGLVLTIDPSYSYTLANGGNSAVKGNEGFFTRAANTTTGVLGITTPIFGYIGGQPYFGGVDLNGDTDLIDTPGRAATGALNNTTQGVEVYAPSTTRTNRYVLISSLRYDVTSNHSVRVSYTHDYGRHRQTGEVGYLLPNGYARNLFPIYSPVVDASGQAIQKRNRKSFAILDQVSGIYTGRFFDRRLSINLGVRAPFFKRKLTNLCVSETGGNGFVDCFNDATSQTSFLAANPGYQAPQTREFKYNKVLPNAGFTFNVVDRLSVYGNYSKGLQVPATDNLYNSFAFPVNTARARPTPETTDNFDAGVRYTTSRVQAQFAGWYTLYKNRLASAYDPDLDVTIYRNLGTVDKYGFDGSVAVKPIPEVTVYAFGSYLKSKIRDNVVSGECTAAQVTAGTSGCTTVGQVLFAPTAGKREAGAPTFTFGERIQGDFGPISLGAQMKRTGPRFVNDVNLPVIQTYTLNGTAVNYNVYPAKVPAYTLVDLDARISLNKLGMFNDRTYIQLNVTNVFDRLYVAGFTGNLSNSSVRNAYIGSPRTFSGTLVVGF